MLMKVKIVFICFLMISLLFINPKNFFGFGPSSLFMILKPKLIMSRALFSHWMHKLQVVDLKFEIDSLYFNGKCQHAHSEWIYITSQCPFVVVSVVFEIPQNKKRKFVQFALVYHLLSRGSSMTNFKSIKDPFIMLKVKHILKTL